MEGPYFVQLQLWVTEKVDSPTDSRIEGKGKSSGLWVSLLTPGLTAALPPNVCTNDPCGPPLIPFPSTCWLLRRLLGMQGWNEVLL